MKVVKRWYPRFFLLVTLVFGMGACDLFGDDGEEAEEKLQPGTFRAEGRGDTAADLEGSARFQIKDDTFFLRLKTGEADATPSDSERVDTGIFFEASGMEAPARQAYPVGCDSTEVSGERVLSITAGGLPVTLSGDIRTGVLTITDLETSRVEGTFTVSEIVARCDFDDSGRIGTVGIMGSFIAVPATKEDLSP